MPRSGYSARKVGGKSSGDNANYKKEGYAKGPVPESMIPSKVGVTSKKGYSGPDVQHGSF